MESMSSPALKRSTAAPSAARARTLEISTPAVRLVEPPEPLACELSGLLALLVTDLEGFTSLVERLGDVAAQGVMRDHNRLIRSFVRARQGREIAHTGDGFMIAFRSVSSALSCAREIQSALAQRPSSDATLRVRMGLHAGEPLPEEERLFGHCVNTAVRVCAQADAGSVLVTDVIKQLMLGRFTFGRAQKRTLKGISTPMCLHEFVWREPARTPSDAAPGRGR